MTRESDARARNARDDASSAQANLALLYDAILTSVVRLQAGRQHIQEASSFRERIKDTLQEIERVAIPAGYEAQDIRDTNLAVVALLDSVVLHSNDPVRDEWQRRLLQEELFGQTDAGVVFFDKLARFEARRDSEQLANILEVYLLCLLLGFEGRYSGGLRSDLDGIAERTRKRIEHIRGRGREISPAGMLAEATAPPELARDQRPDHSRLILVAAIAITVIAFLFFKVNLIWTADQLRSQLLH